MAIYNTSSDASNTSVRAFLTKVGELYLGHGFNTGSGKGKAIWDDIKSNIFNDSCAYCGLGKEDVPDKKLTIEHLIMFNRAEFGLHHPGNIVPCCKLCNNRTKSSLGTYFIWSDHLKEICSKRDEVKSFPSRLRKINLHHNSGRYAYPKLSKSEVSAIKVIAQSLYQNIKTESEKSLNLYRELKEEFIQ